jgi:uncharacterized membrane protein YhhN
MTLILVLSIAVLSVVAIASFVPARTLHYISKPLVTILIIVLAMCRPPADRTCEVLVVIGLCFSLAGDVFLMLPDKPRSYFLPGLGVFFAAHVFYIVAFSIGATWTARQLVFLLPIALVGGVLVARLWRHLGDLKVPVLAYTTIIVVMTWRAVSRLDMPAVSQASAALAAAGAVLFMASDACLAIDRFARRFAGSRVVVLGTYFAGQTLIALSVHA